jgi:transposase
MGLVTKDHGWCISDELWQQIEPLLPPRKPHPLGCHNPRRPDRDASGKLWTPPGARGCPVRWSWLRWMAR